MKKIICLIFIFFVVITMFLFSKTKNSSKIIINREENNGYMNVIQSDIIIEKKNKSTYNIYSDYIVSDFEILEEKEKYTRKDISLYGGEKIILSITPGEYRLKCITPINRQNNYLNKTKDWESEYKYIKLKENSELSLNIYPKTDEGKYLGEWVLD